MTIARSITRSPARTVARGVTDNLSEGNPIGVQLIAGYPDVVASEWSAFSPWSLASGNLVVGGSTSGYALHNVTLYPGEVYDLSLRALSFSFNPDVVVQIGGTDTGIDIQANTTYTANGVVMTSDPTYSGLAFNKSTGVGVALFSVDQISLIRVA